MGETHKNASVFIEKKIGLSINNGAWFVRKAPGNSSSETGVDIDMELLES